ncbi:porin family protein [Robiginitalea biformata]|uniref:Phosphate-selective porin O and P n=1 Tax=Robiginitalea biformata (strain ATCC BAA-864 / DSM 15991 / KCTC 12146 / HTCC2501) TaxID=313596 RepID=A4CGX2_ROBBH|nr:hypothetical protein [Robiginitalea biformata]EAR16180.1 hypothetical protein RB2501_04760 [Robiginitalea biformata HTCC2501]
MKKLLVFMTILAFGSSAFGQTYNTFEPSKTQFMLRGYGHTGFEYMDSGDESESTFLGSAFAPIFLYKHSDRLMFEAELEFVLEGNELETGLEYADVMYVLNKNMTVRAGKFLLPFGTFIERLHPAWINRLPNAPLGYGHDGIAPSSGIGVELRGAFDLGGPKLNYSVYSTNGPRIKDGSEEPEEAGILEFANYEDTNLAKAFGGRIGLLPFSDSSTEIGFSAYSTSGTGEEGSEFEDIGAFLYALDFSLVKQIPGLSGIVDVKAQYNSSNVDTATFIEMHEDGDLEEYSFDNQSNSFYAQLSYRPTMASSDFVKKLELVGRYSDFNAPEGAEWEEKSTQYAFGLNYWLSWRSVVKLSYQTTETEGGHDGDGITNTNGLFLHWAIGF